MSERPGNIGKDSNNMVANDAWDAVGTTYEGKNVDEIELDRIM